MSTSCSSLSGSLMGERLRGTFCMTVCGTEGKKIMCYTAAHAGHTLPVKLHTQLHLCLSVCVSDVHLMCLCVDAFCIRTCVCLLVFVQVYECITLLADAAVCRFSWVLLIGSEVLLPLSLCLCLHSRQFLTATQHTEKRKTVLLEPMP